MTKYKCRKTSNLVSTSAVMSTCSPRMVIDHTRHITIDLPYKTMQSHDQQLIIKLQKHRRHQWDQKEGQGQTWGPNYYIHHQVLYVCTLNKYRKSIQLSTLPKDLTHAPLINKLASCCIVWNVHGQRSHKLGINTQSPYPNTTQYYTTLSLH
jgi:hypothetical protein